MSKLAIDIVLLPSDPMTDKTIEVNSQLVRRFGEKIVFNKENCFPHISLCMGVLEEKNIPAVAKILTKIGKRFSPLNLTAANLSSHLDSKGEMISDFEIKVTQELQLLHETIMKETSLLLTRETSAGMLAPPPPFSEGTFQWIKNYPEKSSFKNFRPHITAGFGEAEHVKLQIKFTASELALCHIGNHCTCRNLLVFAELTK
jgi:2'-5' RNA ligase